jgi:hypothetical protein
LLSALRSRPQLAAENSFLRKHLTLYLVRPLKPRRADNATRITLVASSRFQSAVDEFDSMAVIDQQAVFGFRASTGDPEADAIAAG